MLPLQALSSAQPVANGLDAKRLIVKPIGGTPLENLCLASNTDDGYVFGEYGDYNVDLNTIAQSTNSIDTVTGQVLHDQELDEVVNTVADAVTNHLAFARTVVAPNVDDLVQRVASAIEQIMRSEMNQLEMVTYRQPAPLLEPSIVDSFMRSKEVSPEQILTGFGFSFTLEDFQNVVNDLILTGQVSADEAIGQYLEKLGINKVYDIVASVFNDPIGTEGRNVWDIFNLPNDGLDAALITFLIARKIWDNPPEVASGINRSIEAYKDQMSTLRNQAAIRLVHEINKADVDANAGILVRSYTSSSVIVNEAVCRKFMEEGGSAEILFGNILSPYPRVTVSEIMEKAEEYKKNWETYTLLSKTTEQNKKFNTAKSVIKIEFLAFMERASHDDIPLQEREIVGRLFDEALACTKQEEVCDLYGLVLRLLCSSVYHKTDAFFILNGVNRVKCDNPEIDVREAAAVVAIEYIARWVANQFQVVPATQ